jgi:tRNA/tmRNA/rRNA uracil-C5-methylase (TrmA/RlmC/RlmD family)
MPGILPSGTSYGTLEAVSATIEVEVTSVAAGGDGVGRLPDGRVAFVAGALPGERVTAEVTEVQKRFLKAGVIEVLEASPDRVAPPCPQVDAGCGGCAWQHVAPGAQRSLKERIVEDSLRRIGKLEPPPVQQAAMLGVETAGRTTVRAAVDPEGHLGFRRHHAHDVVSVEASGCLVAHRLVDEVLRGAWFSAKVTEATVRVGAATGDRLVLAEPVAPEDSVVPEGTVLVGADALAAGHRAWIHEEVAGRRWRISAESFFQPTPEGAALLVDLVAAALGDALRPGAAMVDLYAGVGLFAGALGPRTGGARIETVEANRAATADARVNLADLPRVKVIGADVRKWRPSKAQVVIADPSRHGLGAEVVDRIGVTEAGALALVSCDPGALGRDAGLLARAGWTLESVTLADLFPHTPHVEVVTGWRRPSAR